MGLVKDKYSSLIIFKDSTRALSEAAIGSMTDVSLHEASITITSVSDVGGIAEFNFTPGPTLVVGQEVTISGFLVETTYNVTGIITVTSAGDFQIGIAFTGTEASVGSFIELVARERALVADDAYKTMYENLYDFEIDELIADQWDTIQTTDAATSTLISTIVIAASTIQIVTARLIASEVDTDLGFLEVSATIYRAAAGDPVLSAQNDGAGPDLELQPTGWGAQSATFSINSPNVELHVTGVAATTIDWTCQVHIEPFT